MKRLIIFSAAFLIVGLAACQDDFLDKRPLVGTTTDNFYNSEEDAIAAVNGAYAALQFEVSPAGHFRWFWGDIMSDDSEKGGSGDNDVFDLLLLETFQGPANTDLLESEWKANYQGIYRANLVLENVPEIEMDETLKARILGEAQFIRAWFHFNLVTVFGGVPIADEVLAPSEYTKARDSAEAVWALIEQDLLAAQASLPTKSNYGVNDMGRITQGAAQALLAKSFLYQKKFTEAKQQCELVVNSGEYSLAPSYATIFTEEGEYGPGSIFEINYMNASGGNWGDNNANEGTFTNIFQRPRGQFEGYGFNLPTQDFVDAFFAEGQEDPRLNSTVFQEGDLMGDRGLFTFEATGYDHPYYPKKYFNNKSEEAPFGDVAPNGGSNTRVLRYADVLLMHAEACAETNDESTALSSLNTVRGRVGMPTISASGPELLDRIFHERRVELGLESQRFFDLVRSGRATAELGPLGYMEGVHNVFPIPTSQIQASNGTVLQNPGY